MFIIAMAAAVVAGATSEAASPADDCFQTANISASRLIEACTEIINSSKMKKVSLASAHYNRAIAWEAQNESAKALIDYNAAILLDAKFEVAYVNRGHLLLKEGNESSALADFKAAISINSTDYRPYKLIAETSYRHGKYDDAITSLSIAIKLAQNRSDLYVDRCAAYIRRYEIYKNSLDLDSAHSDCDMAVKFDLNNAAAYKNRGWIWLSMGRTDDARADFAKAAELSGRARRDTGLRVDAPIPVPPGRSPS
jgi:tetratricopeptide (TPR) repeat protein